MSMQGYLWSRPPSDAERFIFVGDGNKVAVEAIGTFRLRLKTGFLLDLFETFVAPSFRRNLISISSLDKSGFYCSFGNNKVSLSQNSCIVGSGSLIDNLYMLDVAGSYNEILQTSSRGTKRKLNENSAALWHKRLGHISKQRIQRLVSDEILEPLDLSDFQVCIECIKGKQTNTKKLGVERGKDVLELIHTDICGPFPTPSNRSSTKSKFIDIKFLVVKERVQNRQISIEHIRTNFMLADPLTKGLTPKVFHEHTTHMGVIHEDTLV